MKKRCNGITRAGTKCKNTAQCRFHSAHGKGIIKHVKKTIGKLIPKAISSRVKALVSGPNKGPPKNFTTFLNKTEGHKVKSIYVVRKPIVSGVKTVLNIMSLGKFTQKQRDLKYDNVYHNYMIVELDDGTFYKIEKNQRVVASKATKSDFEHEKYSVPVPPNTTVKQLIETASKGDSQSFYHYSANKNNCQKFIQEIIKDNGIKVDDPKAQELINPQRADLLVDSLSGFKPIVQKVTDVANIADTVWNGGKLLKKRKGKGLTAPPQAALDRADIFMRDLFSKKGAYNI